MNSAGKDGRQQGTLERTGQNRGRGEKDRPGTVKEERLSEMSDNSPEESGGQEGDSRGRGEKLSEASARSLPGELYNFYDMEQYRTPGQDEPLRESSKQFDIWLQDFDKQVKWLNYR